MSFRLEYFQPKSSYVHIEVFSRKSSCLHIEHFSAENVLAYTRACILIYILSIWYFNLIFFRLS